MLGAQVGFLSPAPVSWRGLVRGHGPASLDGPLLSQVGVPAPSLPEGCLKQSLCPVLEWGIRSFRPHWLALSHGRLNPQSVLGGQQWSRSALAPLWGDVPPEPSKPGKGLDCLGSPLLPSSFVPTPSGVNLGVSTEPICIPECKELWGQHAPSITLGCAYVLETLSNVFHGSHFPHRGSCPFG